MLSPFALSALARTPRRSLPLLPPALLLLASLDFTLPRLLPPSSLPLLDRQHNWKPGTASRVLSLLSSLDILLPLGTGGLYSLSPRATWTPRALAEVWREEAAVRERVPC
jgi:hypothetical protein